MVAAVKQFSFTLSAIFGAIAGALYASFTSVISPDVFSFDVTIIVLVSLLLGGSGSVGGAIIGTVIVYMLPEWLRGIGQYYMIIYGAGIILLMVFLPTGLIGIVETIRLSKAHSITAPILSHASRDTGADRHERNNVAAIGKAPA